MLKGLGRLGGAWRIAVWAALAALLVAAMPACSRSEDANTVVLYSSVDDGVIRPLLAEFEKRKGGGFKVLLVGDTEATKTTGLVQRMLAEKDRPQADVWWSSEALGTVRLAKAGLFAPYTSAAAEADLRLVGPPRSAGRGRTGTDSRCDRECLSITLVGWRKRTSRERSSI